MLRYLSLLDFFEISSVERTKEHEYLYKRDCLFVVNIQDLRRYHHLKNWTCFLDLQR